MNTIQASKVLIRGVTAILFSGVSAMNCFAQEGCVSSGGSASGLNGSVGFTVGQVTCVLQGDFPGRIDIEAQEPVDDFGASMRGNHNGFEAKIKVSPNPTVDNVVLEIDDSLSFPSNALLYDKYGLLVQAVPVYGRQTRILMGGCSTGIYTLQVSLNDQDVKTFKIIKK